jgi:hypothetical protein
LRGRKRRNVVENAEMQQMIQAQRAGTP